MIRNREKINLLLLGVVFSAMTGIIVGIIIFFYKALGDIISKNGLKMYDKLHDNKILVLPILIFLIIWSLIQVLVVKKAPESKGGGIPTSEGIIRGMLNINPFTTFFSTLVLSYVSFLVGLPLGSEGPSVMLGTTFSDILSVLLPSNMKAYRRYIMTGGASTAFAVATGAPISGVIFALEEIHKKFSPMLLLVSMSSVLSGSAVAYFLSSKINISYDMFDKIATPKVPFKNYYLFLIAGIAVGFLAVIFTRLIEGVKKLLDKKLANINLFYKILVAFLLTFLIGIVYKDSLGGGHGLIERLWFNDYKAYIVVILLVIKLLMISFVSQSGVTGGMFIPILTIGALAGEIISRVFLLEEYHLVLVTGSMAAFMAASIGCPLSALVFSVEALSGLNNILPISIIVLLAYVVSRMLDTCHVYDIVLERKLKDKYRNRGYLLIELNCEVLESSFSVGKISRDLLLPANTLILCIKRKDKDHFKMDNFGDKVINAGDIVSLRIQTYNIDKTRKELEQFFGKQKEFNYQTIEELKI